jgi:hypothetical protein
MACRPGVDAVRREAMDFGINPLEEWADVFEGV